MGAPRHWQILATIGIVSWVSPAIAQTDIFAEMECKNPSSTPFSVTEAIQNVDKRVVACFNYQQQLARQRDAEYRSRLNELEIRIIDIETKLRALASKIK